MSGKQGCDKIWRKIQVPAAHPTFEAHQLYDLLEKFHLKLLQKLLSMLCRQTSEIKFAETETKQIDILLLILGWKLLFLT